MEFIPYMKGGKLRANFTQDFSGPIDMIDYNVELVGETDFSKAIDHILNNFKQFFKVEVAGLLTDSVSNAFSHFIYKYSKDSDAILALTARKEVYLNASLTNNTGLIIE